jgi:hypothetical protein
VVARQVRLSILKVYLVALLLGLLGLAPLLGLAKLEARGGAGGWSHGLAALALAAGAAAAGVLSWGVLLTVRPGWHPIYRRLARFGPPRAVAAAVDAEVGSGEVVKVGLRRASELHEPVLLTRSWLVQASAFGLRLVRLGDVVWVRKVAFAPRADLSGWPATPAWFVEVKVRDGGGQYFGLAEADCDVLLAELVGRLPWVLSGVDERWEGRWQDDRAGLLAEVDGQRELIQGQDVRARGALVEEKVRQACARALVVEGKRGPRNP